MILVLEVYSIFFVITYAFYIILNSINFLYSCDCHNNTESDPTCSSKSQACWNFQCSKCKDSFMGTPTGGHQCYKQISVDTRSCLDATPVDDADLKPSPLNPGQAVSAILSI